MWPPALSPPPCCARVAGDSLTEGVRTAAGARVQGRPPGSPKRWLQSQTKPVVGQSRSLGLCWWPQPVCLPPTIPIPQPQFVPPALKAGCSGR